MALDRRVVKIRSWKNMKLFGLAPPTADTQSAPWGGKIRLFSQNKPAAFHTFALSDRQKSGNQRGDQWIHTCFIHTLRFENKRNDTQAASVLYQMNRNAILVSLMVKIKKKNSSSIQGTSHYICCFVFLKKGHNAYVIPRLSEAVLQQLHSSAWWWKAITIMRAEKSLHMSWTGHAVDTFFVPMWSPLHIYRLFLHHWLCSGWPRPSN